MLMMTMMLVMVVMLGDVDDDDDVGDGGDGGDVGDGDTSPSGLLLPALLPTVAYIPPSPSLPLLLG